MTLTTKIVLIDDEDTYRTGTVVEQLDGFVLVQLHDMSGDDAAMPCILLSLDEASSVLSDGRSHVLFFDDAAHLAAWQDWMGFNDDEKKEGGKIVALKRNKN